MSERQGKMEYPVCRVACKAVVFIFHQPIQAIDSFSPYEGFLIGLKEAIGSNP
jgi:hypothetical protein